MYFGDCPGLKISAVLLLCVLFSFLAFYHAAGSACHDTKYFLVPSSDYPLEGMDYSLHTTPPASRWEPRRVQINGHTRTSFLKNWTPYDMIPPI